MHHERGGVISQVCCRNKEIIKIKNMTYCPFHSSDVWSLKLQASQCIWVKNIRESPVVDWMHYLSYTGQTCVVDVESDVAPAVAAG